MAETQKDKSSRDVVLTNKLGTREKFNQIFSEGDAPEDIKRFNSILENINSFFNPDYAISTVKNVTNFIDKYYFRSKFVGLDGEVLKKNNPQHPLIFASNHSGMTFPWDGIVMASKLLTHNNFTFNDSIRPVVAPMLSQSVYMNPFMIQNFWRKLGGVDATLENFEALMHSGDYNVMIYPEGVPGIGKGFDKKYQLQRLSSSFIRMALKFKVNIVPIATINGEYLNPYSYKSDELNKLVNKLKIPFLPLGPMSLLAPVYPWAFYFALPAKLTFVFGRPIKVYEMIDKPLHKIKKAEISQLRDVVERELQLLINEGLSRYGKDPFDWNELGDLWAHNLDKIQYILPSGWPALFLEHERLYKENHGRPFQMDYSLGSFLNANIKSPEPVEFNIPVAGWFMLLKSKGII